MGSRATTLNDQIALLRSRGMTIANEDKAKEVLFDVGYYRLGFYWFPFEKSCKDRVSRIHEFRNGANFDDAVKLYYFDYSLRNLLQKYMTRIEVNFRTHLVYLVSNEYADLPTWFISPLIVDKAYINSFDSEVYNANFKRNKYISNHHRIHINDQYAPAWKTLEFMTLGSNIVLYKSLLDLDLKKRIASDYGINYTGVFENYLDVVRCVRNTCAHGGVLYDIILHPLIRRGPACVRGYEDRNLYGAIKVIRYLLARISQNRAHDLDENLQELLDKYASTSALKWVLTDISGFQL